MKVVVTGGAGYIGSFMTKRLMDEGYSVTVIDSLERGYQDAVDPRADLRTGSLLDQSFVDSVFSEVEADAVFHFAAYISVAESTREPGRYYQNNVMASLMLLEAMRKNKVQNFIFSSTAAVYGNPVTVPIPEDHQKKPESPYGHSKLMVEEILSWYQKIHGMSFAALRYFNASGAAMDGSMGESHTPESHLIPNAIAAIIEDREFTLFGSDYDTPDGTCIRDYIHVLDLVEAHLLALKKISEESGGYRYNVGAGKGYSNKEVVDIVSKVAGKEVRLKMAERRPGDPATLVANAGRISEELHFTPKFSDLETIVSSAWKWHSNNRSK